MSERGSVISKTSRQAALGEPGLGVWLKTIPDAVDHVERSLPLERPEVGPTASSRWTETILYIFTVAFTRLPIACTWRCGHQFASVWQTLQTFDC